MNNGVLAAVGCAVVCSACARSALAAFVPRLEVRCVLSQSRLTEVAPERGQVSASISASLRWQPRVEAAAIPLSYELSPAASATPCGEDDVECLREVAEVEAELGLVLGDLL